MHEITGVAVPSFGRIKANLHKRLGYDRAEKMPADIRARLVWAVALARLLSQPAAVLESRPIKKTGTKFIHAEGLSLASPRWAGLMKKSQNPKTLLAMCCTLGEPMDRLLALCQRRSLAMGYLMDAVGSEIMEIVMDRLAKNLPKDPALSGLEWSARLSPGYCDWPLAAQKDLFSLLDPSRIGVSLAKGLGMVPSKTVSAVLLGAESLHRPSPCRYCPDLACKHRREPRARQDKEKKQPVGLLGGQLF